MQGVIKRQAGHTHHSGMICARHKQLREGFELAHGRWDHTVLTTKLNAAAALVLRYARDERDETMELLSRHKGTCLLCSNIHDK